MILAQFGYGPSDRVEIGLDDGGVKGVILNASNIKPEQILPYCQSLKETSSETVLFFDPEYYVNLVQEADKFGKLGDYPYFHHPMTISDLASPKMLTNAVSKVVDVQATSELPNILSPTVEIVSFGGSTEPYVLSMLHATLEYVEDNDIEGRIYASLLINENAFDDADKMALFLDAITRVRGVDGYYIVVDRTDAYKHYWNNPQTLAAYMYFVNALSAHKEVILGYADGIGLLGLAVGAKYAATGWWMNSSSFTKQRFISSSGRRKSKYYSQQLMTTINVDGELSVLVSRGKKDLIANTSKYDGGVSSDPLNPTVWGEREAIFHKWLVMNEMCNQDYSSNNEAERLQNIEERLVRAKELSEEMDSFLPDGFETAHGPAHLQVMLSAVDIYKKGVV